MIKQTPFVSEKIWGSERWVVSTYCAGQSLSADGGVPLGYDYPLLVKVIQADARLSVQLHPESAYARAHGASRGKTECWYVLGAAEGATVTCGFTGSPSLQELRAAHKERPSLLCKLARHRSNERGLRAPLVRLNRGGDLPARAATVVRYLPLLAGAKRRA